MSKRARRRLVMVVALTCTAAAGVVAFKWLRAVQQQRIVAQAREAGLAAYDAGDYEKALDELKVYVAHRKNDPAVVGTLVKFAHARLRIPLSNGQHVPEAMNLYLHARKLLNDGADVENRSQLQREVRSSLLEVYLLMGMRPELIATAERILEDDPDHIDALAARSQAVMIDQRYEEAKGNIDRLIELQPDEMSWRHLALQNMRGLQYSDRQLLAQCDQWIEAWQGDGRLSVLKAGWLEELGRREEARAEALRAAEAGAESLQVLQHLVTILDLLGLPEEASGVLEEAQARFAGEQWVAEAKARRAWNTGNIERALAEIEEADERFESLDLPLLKLKASLLLAANRQAEISAVLSRLRAAGGNREAGRAADAWADAIEERVAHAQSSFQQTVDAFRAAIATNPDDAMMRFLLAETYGRIGERAMAVTHYERAVALEPNWIAARAALAEALLSVGRPDEAYQASRRLIQRSSTNQFSLYVLLAQSYIGSVRAGGNPVLLQAGTSRPIDIVMMLQAMHDQSPEHATTTALLAEACCLTGRTSRAHQVVDEALAAGETGAETLLELAEVSARYELEREPELVAAAREKAGLTVPVALAQASMFADQGQVEDGLVLIDEALKEAESPALRSVGRRGRTSYLLRVDHPEALEALRDLVLSEHGSVEAQVFALSQPATWRDRRLVRTAIDQLSDTLGSYSPHVRIAEANYLLRFHPGDEAKRAESMTMLSEVLAQSPHSVPALILLSQAWLVGERPSFDRAITYLKRAVDAAPGRRELYAQLVALLQGQGDYESADRYLQRLSRLPNPGRDALRRELQLLEAQGDFETALLRANRLIREDAEATDQLALAALHLRAGDYAAAEDIYLRLLGSHRHDELVVAQAAEFYRSTGRSERGLDLLHSMPEGSRQALLIGQYLHRSGRPQEAEKWLMQVLEQEPDLVEARHQLARLYLDTDRAERARDESLRGLEESPDHTGLRSALASANLALGKAGQEDAIRLLREIGQADDSLIATLELLERVPKKNGQARPTARNLRDAQALVQEHPHFMPGWMLAVTLHSDARKHREAVDLARRAVSRFPANPEPAEWATRLLIQTGDFRQALAEAQEWRRRALHDPLEVDLLVASILLELDRADEAVAQLERHADRFIADAESQPSSVGIWMRALVQDGRVSDAWTMFQPLAEDDDRWLEAWRGLVDLMPPHIGFDVLGAAEPLMIERGPESTMQLARDWIAFGNRHGGSESFERASDAMERVSFGQEHRVPWMFLNGRIAEGLGDLEEAERWYREVLAGSPEHAAALNNLAYVLTKDDRRASEAVNFAERALATQPDHPDLLDTYAHALLAAGQTEAARDAIKRALAQRPEDVGLSLSLAEVLLADRSYGEATEILNSARRRMEREEGSTPVQRRRAEDLARQLSQLQVSIEP